MTSSVDWHKELEDKKEGGEFTKDKNFTGSNLAWFGFMAYYYIIAEGFFLYYHFSLLISYHSV